MSFHGIFGGNRKKKQEQNEKAWLRKEATAWDLKWHTLSFEARAAYLGPIKPTTKPGSSTQITTPVTSVNSIALEELVKAGFVKVEPSFGKRAARIVPLNTAHDFSTRIRASQRYHLLGPKNHASLINFLRYVYVDVGRSTIAAILARANVNDVHQVDEAIDYYVTSKRWPGWVADASGSKLTRPVIDALLKAPGPVPIVEVPGLLKAAKPESVRDSIEELILNLAVFEDLDPKSLDLVVGLLPEVREALIKASQPGGRPPLIVCERPRDMASASGLAVNDLRVFLLEVASQAPRLRQDSQLFAKEEPRFLAAMPEWPAWLYEFAQSEPFERVTEAYDRSRMFKFTEVEQDEKLVQLRLSTKGRAWLASGLSEQYQAIYSSFRTTSSRSSASYHYYDSEFGDTRFLGISLAVIVPKGKGNTAYYSLYDLKPENCEAVRQSIYKAFATLPVGVFHVWESVVDHLCFGPENPILGGQEDSKVAVFLDHRPIPRLPEQVEEASKRVLNAFLRRRLMPFEAVQVATDDQGRLCVARLARFDGYFGKPYDREADGGTSGGDKVIVQPDFSVFVIGLNPGPAAELAPFCERASGHAGQGSMIFKITRTSVIRAATQGMTAAQINDRLKKHASIPVPENVLQEIREWAGWIRRVNVRAVTVVRCPDAETADRVASLLGKKTERLGEAMVAIDTTRLVPAERQKLQDQGIIITKDEITMTKTDNRAKAAAAAAAAAARTAEPVKKKRGRPKKRL